MTDQILPNEILLEIVRNCPPEDKLKLAIAFRGVNKSFGDILELCRLHATLYCDGLYAMVLFRLEHIYTIYTDNDEIFIKCEIPTRTIRVGLFRGSNTWVSVYRDGVESVVSDFHRGRFLVRSSSYYFREYITNYDHAADTYPDRKHPMGLAQKMFWKTCKYYIPPVIVQFIYDQIQLMERQLRGH